jgi:DNA-binding NtrC family response regulator
MVRTGQFREDLFFRIAVFELTLPPLRERGDDLSLLVSALLAAAFWEELGGQGELPYELLRRWESYDWPGNVRELKNVVERAAILSSDVISIADLPEDPHLSPFDDDPRPAPGAPSASAAVAPVAAPASGEKLSLREYRDAAERAYILQTLIDTDWNISRAAVILSVERTNLHKKIRAYGIKRGDP